MKNKTYNTEFLVTKICDKFIEFAQAESSLFCCNNKTFDIVNTIQAIIKNNENILNSKNLTIDYNIEEFNKKAIYNDENIIKIILQNILETSIKLTDVGSINIKLDHPEMDLVERCGAKVYKNANSSSYLRIAISDTGMGLADSELEGIFEPYTQLDKSHRKTFLRSLSLGSAYTMLKKMGGALWVNSEVMKGSTFFIVIPIEKEIISQE